MVGQVCGTPREGEQLYHNDDSESTCERCWHVWSTHCRLAAWAVAGGVVYYWYRSEKEAAVKQQQKSGAGNAVAPAPTVFSEEDAQRWNSRVAASHPESFRTREAAQARTEARQIRQIRQSDTNE